MSDDATATTDAPTDEPPATPSTGHSDTETSRQMVRTAQWAAFALLVLVALLATVRLYFAVSTAVETFVTRRYRPLFMAGFNLVVLLCCVGGLSALVRRLT
ncbi:hypothetical protein NDI56_05035 [Haloarcula sp. S1CR25-12]|uniref:DUF8060 domain-containing protein n=1 Tax=Haloarcula saliterrae TaxID=2950534 RepID=A0ABU2FAL7_9EURY|nr:hypothetical protein [Haloarcula sp. S1CR25-12]MDS0258755.1 hypothetical protein [Haloarcula sp. S1CR25-12]